MTGTRGRNKQPGKVRRSQNWIGGTRPGNVTVVGAKLFENLPRNPLVTVKSVVKICRTSSRSRSRVYAYREYLDLLRQGTEL